MMMSQHFSCLSFFLMLFYAGSLFAQDTAAQPVLKVSGEVSNPLSLLASVIAAMPHHTAVLNDHSGHPRTYSGVYIQDILTRAGAAMGKELRGENLDEYLLVKCADGYEVVFSLAELDSSFTSRPAILADSSEGKPLPETRGPFRLIIPGEKIPARSCFQVMDMIVRHAGD